MARYDWIVRLFAYSNVTRLNQCENPSFETNTTGWTASAGTTLTRVADAEAYAGANVLRAEATSTSTSNNAIYDSPRPAALPGQSWVASAYVKITAGAARDHRIIIEWFNGATSLSTTVGTVVNVPNTGSWRRIDVIGTAPANTTALRCYIQYQRTNAAVGNRTSIDAVLLEQTTRLKPYFDGSTIPSLTSRAERDQQYSWLGTANNSVSQNICEEANFDPPFTELDGVQSLSITRGRTQIQDPYRASTAVISGRNPSGLPSIKIYDVIEIIAVNPSASVFEVYSGSISNIDIKYGFVANEDTWSISLEDALAKAGRGFIPEAYTGWSAGFNTIQAAQSAASISEVNVNATVADAGSTVSAQNPKNQNLLSVLNQLAATEQGRLRAVNEVTITFTGRKALGASTVAVVFGDVLSGTVVPYSEIEFQSIGDSYYTRVDVNPEGLAAQSSGIGSRTFSLSSYDQTTSQAQDLADYVLATLDVNTAAPQRISTTSEMQSVTPNDNALTAAVSAGLGERATLNFRGNTYNLFIEGSTITATPEQTRFSFNVVSADALNFFILDSATFGVLDTNKLGF